MLVASTNNQAVDVACDKSKALWPGLVIRTGSQVHRQAAAAELLSLLDERPQVPDLGALWAAFRAARTRADTLRESADSLTTVEARLAEVQLGRETLASAIERPLTALTSPLTDRSVKRLSQTLSRLAKRRGFFRRWRLKRLGERLHFNVEEHLAETARLFALEREWRELKLGVDAATPFEETWRALIKAERSYETESGRLAAALAQVGFRDGASSIRRFAVARARFGVPGGPSSVLRDTLRYARAWASTALSAGATIPLEPGLFDLVVIDEASQCSIPAILPLLYRARRAVIIGDLKQLEHITTISRRDDGEKIREAGLDPDVLRKAHLSYSDNSVFRALEGQVETVRVLDEHYRSHPEIAEIANRLFYAGELSVLTDPKVFQQLDLPAVSWRNVSGRATKPSGGSAYNQAEAEAVALIVAELASNAKFTGNVGVVTPFSAQMRLITSTVERLLPESVRDGFELVVGTAHRFQGDERDVVIFSPVLAEGLPAQTAGWIEATPNLVNVAISRARSALIIVGNQEFCLGQPGPLRELARCNRDIEDRRQVDQAAARGDIHSLAELRLHEALVHEGLRVEPKVVIRGYEADFVIRAGDVMVNLECDGRQAHTDGAGRLRRQDRARDALIEAQGWRVIRVPAWKCLVEPARVARELRSHWDQ